MAGSAALYSAALALTGAGRIDEAEPLYRRIVAAEPNHAGAAHQLGLIGLYRGDRDAAITWLTRAADAPGERAEAVRDLAVMLDSGAALDLLRRKAQAAPSNLALQLLLAEALLRHGDNAGAVQAYRRVVGLDPANPAHAVNLGVALLALDRSEEAVGHFARALAVRPDFAEARFNLGVALQSLNRFGAARRAYAAAMAIRPDYAEAQWNDALAALATGDFAAGWAGYEWRWRNPALGLVRRRFACPQWTGAQDLAGRTLFLHAEQGLGDTLQFMRFVPLAAARGATVRLELPETLLRYCAKIEGVASLHRAGDAVPKADFHCPLPSLPGALGIRIDTIPPPVGGRPAADAMAFWADWLAALPRPRIGLAWAGNPANSNDRRRSIGLAPLRPLLGLPCGFVSLQQDRLAAHPALAVPPRPFNDFADTAALMAQLDLVIAIDSAMAHLAGSLGKTLWVLLAHAPDWRWHPGRAESPWYPSAQLFRQQAPGDWQGVMAAVRDAL